MFMENKYVYMLEVIGYDLKEHIDDIGKVQLV